MHSLQGWLTVGLTTSFHSYQLPDSCYMPYLHRSSHSSVTPMAVYKPPCSSLLSSPTVSPPPQVHQSTYSCLVSLSTSLLIPLHWASIFLPTPQPVPSPDTSGQLSEKTNAPPMSSCRTPSPVSLRRTSPASCGSHAKLPSPPMLNPSSSSFSVV